jgi:hypothetical protein
MEDAERRAIERGCQCPKANLQHVPDPVAGVMRCFVTHTSPVLAAAPGSARPGDRRHRRGVAMTLTADVSWYDPEVDGRWPEIFVCDDSVEVGRAAVDWSSRCA